MTPALDPLCLTPPTGSILNSACVSPFELEKRPQKPNGGGDAIALGDGLGGGVGGGVSLSKSASALQFSGEGGEAAAADKESELREEPVKESDYAAFVETLLAM